MHDCANTTRRAFLQAFMAASGGLLGILFPQSPARSTDAQTPERRYRWVRVTDGAAFAPRDGAGALVFRGKMWLLGGWNPGDKTHFPKICNSEVWSSADGANWKLETMAPWEPRHTAGYVVHDGKMWIVGGDAIQRHYQNDVWSSADGVQWTRHVEHAPFFPRQYHEVAVFDNAMWVLEGWNGSNRNDVWYSSDGVRWRELPGTPWAPRHAASVFVYDNALWMVAGNNMQSDVWRLVGR